MAGREVSFHLPDGPVTLQLQIKPQHGEARGFTKVYTAVVDAARHERLFTDEESALLLCLMGRLQYGTNAVLGVASDFITQEAMARLMGWSLAKLERVMARLQRKNAVARVRAKEDTYFLNPDLCWRGPVGEVNRVLRIMFRERAVGKEVLRLYRKRDTTLVVH